MPFSKLLRGLLIPSVALLTGCNAVLLSPSGDVALQQRNLILISTGLMLLIIIPVIALTFLFAWRYRASHKRGDYDPEWNHSTILELVIWSAPLLIIIALGALTWVSTHLLDPYRPLERIAAGRPVPADVRPLQVEVVALDWKWLFIYPEQGIATVNELAAPVDRPIEFKITASTVMNSFFIPAVAGQVYAMPSMQTVLNAVVNRPGTFEGFSANYSGAGFSGMRFDFYGMSESDFDLWVKRNQATGSELSRAAYLTLEPPSEQQLANPSLRLPVTRYGRVAPGLFQAIVNRCVDPAQACMNDTMRLDAMRNRPDAAPAMKSMEHMPGMAMPAATSTSGHASEHSPATAHSHE